MNGFYGFGSFGGFKSKYRKLSKRELTDKLMFLEDRFNELVKDNFGKPNKSNDELMPMISKMLDVSNIENKLKLEIINTIDEKIQAHINAYHKKGD